MVWTRTHTVVTSIAAGTAGLIAVGVLALAPRGEAAAQADGPRISIDVVAPREPVPVEGGVMTVGELTDGYEHHPYVRSATYEPLPDAWVEEEPLPMPEPRRWTSEPPVEPQASVVTVRAQGDPMKFGFDEPTPDYAAERRERQARMERIEAENASRATTPSGAQLTRDSTFY